MPHQTFLADIQQLPHMIQFVVQSAQDLGIEDKKTLAHLELVTEEVCSNIIQYGFLKKQKGTLALSIVKNRNRALVFEVRDDGIAYDPTQHSQVDTQASLEERTYGGYGIHLVRTLMDEISYHRENSQNVLKMKILGVF